MRKSDLFPDSIPFFPNIPGHLRSRVFRYLETPLPESEPGKVLVKPLFEKILQQILTRDYGVDESTLNPAKASSRGAAVADLICMCKFICLFGFSFW